MAQGWVKPHNGPYAGPTGNPVMKAKRTTGPSAQARLAEIHTRDLAKERARLGASIQEDKRVAAKVQSLWWLPQNRG